MADAKGTTIIAPALAWLLHQQVLSSVIIGAKKFLRRCRNATLGSADLWLNEDGTARTPGRQGSRRYTSPAFHFVTSIIPG